MHQPSSARVVNLTSDRDCYYKRDSYTIRSRTTSRETSNTNFNNESIINKMGKNVDLCNTLSYRANLTAIDNIEKTDCNMGYRGSERISSIPNSNVKHQKKLSQGEIQSPRTKEIESHTYNIV